MTEKFDYKQIQFLVNLMKLKLLRSVSHQHQLTHNTV